MNGIRRHLVVWLGVAAVLVAARQSIAAEPTASGDQETPEVITDEEFRLPLDAETAVEVDGLIERLGSPAYRERESASGRLTDIGAAGFSKLRSAYRETNDLEVRLRIESLVRDAYVYRKVHDRTGYLGIRRARGNLPTHEDDPRIMEGRFGIRLAEVMPDTSARRAGLLANDVIIAVDGVSLGAGDINANKTFQAFAKTIRERGVDGKMLLTVLRGENELQILVVLGPVPRSYASAAQINGIRKLTAEAVNRFDVWWFKYFREPGNGVTMDVNTP